LAQGPDVPAVLAGAGVDLHGSKVAAPPPGLGGEAGARGSGGTRLDPYSSEGKAQLARLREVPAPGPTLFGGPAALNRDAVAAIAERLPAAGILIAVTTL
ncbi:MMPL family transporter, partial [Nocardia farcinica]|nr:MMPL family transporter [Nocardia farcinica]